MNKLLVYVFWVFAALSGFAASINDLTWEISGGKVVITDCDQAASGSLVIPAVIEGYPVTSIDSYAIAYCRDLTSIMIPDSVTSIGSWAFSLCSSLTNITIPDSLRSIRYRVFSNCSSLTSIVIPDSVVSIGSSAFEGCSSLTSIVIPDGVMSIEEDAFLKTGIEFIRDSNGCDYLISATGQSAFLISGAIASNDIVIPDEILGSKVTLIADYAFSDRNAVSITIPESVTIIGVAAFQDCRSLTRVTISDGVTRIGPVAFRRCSSLTSITIPDSVTSIGGSAFEDCNSLIDITIPNRFSAHYAYMDLSPDQSQPLFNKAVAANDTVSSNTSRIEAIEAQLALLADALAAKDAEIEEKNERIAQLEAAGTSGILGILVRERDEEIAILKQRPTQAEYDDVVAERDERSTLEELQDARAGSVILAPDENGNIQLKLEIEESSDLEVWLNQGKKLEAEFQLTEGKKFMRFALAE